MDCDNFIIHPVSESGVFDHDFFSTEECKKEIDNLKKYLALEGFGLKTEVFFISFKNKRWQCNPGNFLKNNIKKS